MNRSKSASVLLALFATTLVALAHTDQDSRPPPPTAPAGYVVELLPDLLLVFTPSFVALVDWDAQTNTGSPSWVLSDGDVDATPLEQCATIATLVCGAGRVCSLDAQAASCSFTCQNAHGDCGRVPPSGEDPPPPPMF